MADSQQLKQLLEDYKSTYTVPKHPKACPMCKSVVRVYHTNYQEAVFLCSKVDCIWPLGIVENIFGISDSAKLVRYSRQRRKSLQDQDLNSSNEDFQVPQLLSPPATPSQVVPPLTPVREDGDEFVKPSSTLGTPRRQAMTTPVHSMNFMPLPALLSPLPQTPASHRGAGSERSVNIEDDFQLTDTEVSDVESTPRHHHVQSGLDMPDLLNQQSCKYSKDLSQLDLRIQPKSPPPMKIMLKRNNSNDQWNVQNHDQDVVLPDRPALSGKQPVKLDKVVLNLKKSVSGGNTWKITDEPTANVEQTSASLQPKEERRGRKSKVAPPMKIQKGETFLQQQKQTNNAVSTSETPVLAEISANSRANREPEKPKEIEKETIEKEKTKEVPARPKVVKTFSRKTKPNRAKFEAILPAISTSTFNEDAINLRETPSNSFETNWKEVAELTSKAASALQLDNNYSELSHLMKAATGSSNIDLNFVKQIQNKLSINNVSRSGLVTFFVNRSKTSIDLPTEDTTMAVSETNATIQVRLSSHSDGIVGDVLKSKDPIPQVVVEPKRKGRPKNVNSNNKSISTLPNLPLAPSQDHLQDQHLHQQPPAYATPHLMHPQLVKQFKNKLDFLMQTYDFPPDWAQFNIDPHVAMMVTRSQDPAYATVNFEVMLQVYASILQQERQQQEHHVNTGYHQSQNHIDLTATAPSTHERTYAELQPVRNKEVTSATQLVHQHHQQEEVHVVPDEPANQEMPETPASETSSAMPSGRRPVLKQEAMTPMPMSDTDSINIMSVRPQPPSVSMVSGHMASQMEGKHGKIGRGELVVSFNYRSGHFGPIYANSDEEVKAIVALTTSKVEEREYRDRNGGRRSSGVYASAAATRARSMLPPDVISYLDRAFTKRGMKENIVGRKRRNYPQRSKIIRKDPTTGKFMYPDGQPVLTPETIKPEPAIESAVSSSTNLKYVEATSSTSKNHQKMTADIEEILNNTQSQQALSSPDVTSSSQNDEVIRGKISTSLFGGKRRRQFAVLEQKQREKQQKIQEEEEELERNISCPKVSVVPKKQYGRKRKSSEVEKADAVEMIDSLLAHGISANSESAVEKATIQHGFNTRRNSVEATLNPSAGNTNLPAVKRYFNPQIDANENKELFVRDIHKDKVRKFLEKKKKKEEKQRERKFKKMLKTTSKNKYRGMGQDSVTSTLNPQTSEQSTSKRFTKAQKIGGRKMVLKQSGQVVDVPSQEIETPAIEANKGQLTQDERDLMEKLLSISDSLDTMDDAIPAPPEISAGPSSSNIQDNQISDFLPNHEDGPHVLGKDFSSLDDLLC